MVLKQWCLKDGAQTAAPKLIKRLLVQMRDLSMMGKRRMSSALTFVFYPLPHLQICTFAHPLFTIVHRKMGFRYIFRGKKSEKSLRLMWHFLLLTYFLPTYLLHIYLFTYYLLPT